jgi:heme A synthase
MSRRPVHWVALGLVLVTGMTGAITALGDTLFPSGSLAEGLSQDQDPTAHFLIRLRVIHPILAVVTAGLAGMIGLRWQAASGERRGVPADRLFGIVAAVQVAVGLVNLLLLVPIPTQLLHLFVADLMWMAAVGVVAGR